MFQGVIGRNHLLGRPTKLMNGIEILTSYFKKKKNFFEKRKVPDLPGILTDCVPHIS